MNLGVLYLHGKGVKKNPHIAIDLLMQACDGNEVLACAGLGHIYGRGEGIPVDYDSARIYWLLAFIGQHAESCGNLGVLYEDGLGLAKDKGNAVEVYNKACDLGDKKSCKKVTQ